MKTLRRLASLFLGTAFAGSFTDYAENKLVDYPFRGQASGLPASWYVGLDTVSGGSYARVAVPSSLANWAGTQSP